MDYHVQFIWNSMRKRIRINCILNLILFHIKPRVPNFTFKTYSSSFFPFYFLIIKLGFIQNKLDNLDSQQQHPRGNQLTKTTKTKTKSRAQPAQHLTTLTTRREQKYTNQPRDKKKKLTIQTGKA